MNKVLILCCLFYLNAAAYNPGPQNNEFAHNPITPGYGISNYFELMPDKVQTNKIFWSTKKFISQGIKSVKISGNILRLKLKKGYNQDPPRISLYSISGKKVRQFFVPSPQSSGDLLLIPFSQIAKGVYFLYVETKIERIKTKLVCF